MISVEIHVGQRWQTEAAPADLIDIIEQVDEWLWLVRTELGCLVEMADTYILSSYQLVSSGEARVSQPMSSCNRTE